MFSRGNIKEKNEFWIGLKILIKRLFLIFIVGLDIFLYLILKMEVNYYVGN